MLTKIAMLMGEEIEGDRVDKRFQWKVNEDHTWTFDNGDYQGVGHFVTALYSGAHGEANPTDHGLHLGDTLGIKNGRCWRVRASQIPTMFDCYGIAMGWFEDSDGVFVQISGVVQGIGKTWEPGCRVYLPFHGFGTPDQTTRTTRRDAFPIGIAITPENLLLVPRLDI